MLAGGRDPLYREALARPHRPYARVEVWRGGVLLDTLLPDSPDVEAGQLKYSDGSVSATLASRVSRTLQLRVREDLYPYAVDDLLSPFGTELRAFRGIQFGDGSTPYVWQVFRGKVQQPTMGDDGTLTVTAADRAQEVIDNGLIRPVNSNAGGLVVDDWRRLISDGLSDSAFGDLDEFDQRVPALVWEEDRGRALDELATSVGALWYPENDGEFVLRRYAWTVPADPLVTYMDGDDGTVSAASFSRNRQQVWNRIVVTGERLNGDAPVYAVAEDDNPNSATYVGGPFGVRCKTIKLNTPSTQEQAAGAAQAYLQRTLAMNETWRTTMIADPALELGDCVFYSARGRQEVVQVVDTISMPLAYTATMNVTSRAQIVGVLEGGD